MKTACGNGNVVSAGQQVSVSVLLLPVAHYGYGSSGRTQLRVGPLSVVLKLRARLLSPGRWTPPEKRSAPNRLGEQRGRASPRYCREVLVAGKWLSAFLVSSLLLQGAAVHVPLGVCSEPDSWSFMSAGNIYNPKFLQGSTFNLQVFLGVNSHSLS